MKKRQLPDFENQHLKEFCDFVEAKPVTPSSTIDYKVIHKVECDMRPSLWQVYGKFSGIQTIVGIATLYFCPQFNVGFGGHNGTLVIRAYE